MVTSVTVFKNNSSLLNKSTKCKIVASRHDSHRPVSFLLESEIYALSDAAKTMRKGKRNELLVLLLFQSCLRVSEALDLKLRDKVEIKSKHVLMVEHGKGDKPRIIAIPETLYMRLGNYASENGLVNPNEKFFTVTRVRVWQILQIASKVAGLDYKRVYPHLMRHSGSIARLKRTGNIRSLQEHLGHSDSKMTQRYLSTMQAIESLEVESKVEFER
jgi:site-specific recombinase XerD